MMHEKTFLALVVLLVIGVWAVVLQNSGLIPPVSTPKVDVANTVQVRGSVDVDNTVSVDVDNTVTVDTNGPIDVNLAKVVGYSLVSSRQGMYIGVSSTDNTVIPIHWGEITISR